MKKQATPPLIIASNNSGRTWAWPWQMYTGKVKVLPMFEKMIPGWDSKDPEDRDSAHWGAAVLQTMACAALLGAGVTGAVKGFQYIARNRGIGDSNNPAKGIKSKLTTTFDPLSVVDPGDAPEEEAEAAKQETASRNLDALRQIKTAKEEPWAVTRPSVLSGRTITSLAFPLLALGLGVAATDYVVDRVASDIESKKVMARKDRRAKLKGDLFTARAKAARGTLTQEEYDELTARVAAESEDASDMTKTAKRGMDMFSPFDRVKNLGVFRASSEPVRNLMAAVGILATAVGAASFMGSYYYTKASDPNNIQYKAIKKGLNEYAKQKSGMSPIDIGMPSDAYFNMIDGVQPEPAQARKALSRPKATAAELPPPSPRDEIDLSTSRFNNPVSISFD